MSIATRRRSDDFLGLGLVRLGWVGLCIVGGLFAGRVVPLLGSFPPLLTLGVVLALGISMGLVFQKTWDRPWLATAAMVLTFLWPTLDSIAPLKSYVLTFGLALLLGGIGFIRQFKHLMAHPPYGLSVLFVLVSTLYFFFYGSDFVLARMRFGYPVDFLTDVSGDVPAKNIVYLNAVAVWLGFTVGLLPFINTTAEEKDALMGRLLSILTMALSFCLFHVVITNFQSPFGLYLAVLLPIVLATDGWMRDTGYDVQWGRWKIPMRPWSRWNAILAVMLVPLVINKTALVGVGAELVLYWFLTTRYLKDPWTLRPFWHFLSQGVFPKLLLIGGVSAALIGLTVTGILAKVLDKLEYFTEGFSQMSTLNIRQMNWTSLFNYWGNTLDLTTVLFGYGLAGSRETIFYLSAMRQAGHRTLVQTVHNSYIEYAFDYGCFSLLYFGLYLSLIGQFFSRLRQGGKSPDGRQTLRWCAAALAFTLYIAIYGLTDGIRIQILLLIFTFYGITLAYSNPSAYSSK